MRAFAPRGSCRQNVGLREFVWVGVTPSPFRQGRPQVRAPEHDERDQVVRVPEAVALPDRHLYLAVHGLHPGVGHVEGDGAQDHAVGGDDPDAGAPGVGEQVEEGVGLALAVAGAGPRDPSPVAVDHHGHVLAALLVAGLVDADRARAVEPAPPVGLLERGPRAGAYPADGAPVHPHELGERAAAHVRRQPGHLVPERRGEPARRRPRPRDRPRLDAVLRALHAARGALHVAAGGPGVRRPPAPGGQRVVAVAAPPAHRAPGRRPARPGGDDYGFALDSDPIGDVGAQPEGPL